MEGNAAVLDQLDAPTASLLQKAKTQVHQTPACSKLQLMAAVLQEQEECIKETQILSSVESEYIIKYFDSFLEKVSLARSCTVQQELNTMLHCHTETAS